MSARSICYLDNAATTFPKPRSVVREVKKCLEKYCGNPGRSAHSLSLAAANKIYDCRVRAAELVGIDAPENIIFVSGSTFGLNLIIKGILRDGDHVIISDMEHNSVLRPIHKLASEGRIRYDVFPALALGVPSARSVCRSIEALIKSNTRLIMCTHQSNVCSFTLPLAEIGALCKRRGIIFAVDAAQSAGHRQIDMTRQNIDLLCAPSHKGLYGPQGSGFVAINSNAVLETLVEGGNGVDSLMPDMPDFSPERYESGTPATPSIAGLCEGIREVGALGIPYISEQEAELGALLTENIKNINEGSVYASGHSGGVVLFNIGATPAEALAMELDRRGICVRGGFHCSALAHNALGTAHRGALRASFGIFNTKKDVDRLSSALNDVSKKGL